MKTFHNTINIMVAGVGICLLYELLVAYGNPIPTGCMWIILVSIKSILDIANV